MHDLIRPAYGKGCVTDILPAILGYNPPGTSPLPVEFSGTGPNILMVLDGLGWEQLQDRKDIAPFLSSLAGGPITTIAPSTTAAALTSLTTGLTPAEHGVVGYRMRVMGETLNTLRWRTDESGDVRRKIPADTVQPYSPFMGEQVALVSKAEFATSGFSKAHLRGVPLTGYRTPALLGHEVARLAHEGERTIYGYYDGIDKVAHEYGLDSEYEAELAFVDAMMRQLAESLPSGSQLAITADHGQVDCRDGSVEIDSDILEAVDGLSGEGRFRWLHCASGASQSVLEAASERYGDRAWVRSVEQILDEQWFGRAMQPDVRQRIGDVALLPFTPIAFHDPKDTGLFELVGRHGSLTSAEMFVPLIALNT